jgi:anthranilate synthase component II
MILFIDNFDSFTYNIVQAFQIIGEDVKVLRNNEITIDKCLQINPSYILIGPGPKSIESAGSSLDLIHFFKDKIPILGICLGHQLIAHAFKARIIKAPKVMHGKTSKILHNKKNLFEKISQNVEMMRYHSLVIDKISLPDCLQVDALSFDDNQIMAISHRNYPIFGIQFHPESILSKKGINIFKNFIKMTRQKKHPILLNY